MANPLFIGDTSFRVIDSEENANTRGPDNLTVTLRGKYSDLDTEKALWPKGKSASSLGYSNMYLQTKRARHPQSSFAELVLNFDGFISNETSNPISIEDSTSLQSTSLATDDADDDSIQVKFYAQTTTTRWIYYGLNAPKSPRYQIVVGSNINANSIFDPFPVNYSGTLQSKVVGRLIEFRRIEITKGVWLVSETWQNRVEPAETVRISFA